MGARERRPVERGHAPIRGFEGIRRSLSHRRDRRERESHDARRARRDETNDLIDTRTVRAFPVISTAAPTVATRRMRRARRARRSPPRDARASATRFSFTASWHSPRALGHDRHCTILGHSLWTGSVGEGRGLGSPSRCGATTHYLAPPHLTSRLRHPRQHQHQRHREHEPHHERIPFRDPVEPPCWSLHDSRCMVFGRGKTTPARASHQSGGDATSAATLRRAEPGDAAE
jgi:hypothetical protein